MRIREGYQLCKVKDTHVVVATGNAVMDFDGLVTLNDTGVLLWEMLKQERTAQELTDALVKAYQIDAATAGKDVDDFIAKLRGAGFLV